MAVVAGMIFFIVRALFALLPDPLGVIGFAPRERLLDLFCNRDGDLDI